MAKIPQAKAKSKPVPAPKAVRGSKPVPAPKAVRASKAAPVPKAVAVIVDDDDSYLDEPKPKTSPLTLALCILNVLAVLGFAYCLLLDLEKRQAWSYAVFLHDLAIMGLPLQDEDTGSSASRETAPKPNLRSEQLHAAYQNRKPGMRVAETFQIDDPGIPARILPEHLSDETLKDYFGNLYVKTPDIVNTLEKEVGRIKASILVDIEKASRETVDAAKTPEDKRQQLEKVLLPLACNVFQARELDKFMRAVEDARLDTVLAEAVQRRLILDILQPIEMIRPSDVLQPYLEQGGDLTKLTLKQLQDKLTARLDNAMTALNQKKDTIDKRANIAMVLFAIAHAAKPDGKFLYSDGPERTQLAVGINEYTLATLAYTEAERKLEKRMIQLISHDREGNQVQNGEDVERTPGFIDYYPVLIQELRNVLGKVDQAEKRLAALKDQAAQAKKTLEDRQEHLNIMKDKLIRAREKTSKKLAELRLLQTQLFRAQLELTDAAEVNFRLEMILRKEEGLKVPGGPMP
jgi:hypothetical protein